MTKFLYWDEDNEEHDGVIEFWKQIIEHTSEWLKAVHTRDSGLHYWGTLNVQEGGWWADPDKPIVVLWHSVNQSYSDIVLRALLEHFKAKFDKIEGLEWTVEGANGNGGVDWLMIDLTNSTQAALENVYEQWGDCSPVIDDESAYYLGSETQEYYDLRNEEEETTVRDWIYYEIMGTPFEDWDRINMPSYVSDEWGNGNVQYEESESGYIYFGGNDEYEVLTKLVLQALNDGHISVNQSELDEFYTDNSDAEKWLPYRIRQADYNTWAFESDMDFINDEWFASPSVGARETDSEGRKQNNLPGIDD